VDILATAKTVGSWAVSCLRQTSCATVNERAARSERCSHPSRTVSGRGFLASSARRKGRSGPLSDPGSHVFPDVVG
jgi:hypothetical protein